MMETKSVGDVLQDCFDDDDDLFGSSPTPASPAGGKGELISMTIKAATFDASSLPPAKYSLVEPNNKAMVPATLDVPAPKLDAKLEAAKEAAKNTFENLPAVAPPAPGSLDASYKTGTPLTLNLSAVSDNGSASGSEPQTSRPKTPGGSIRGLFGGRRSDVAVPENAVASEKAESHLAGVMDDPRSCKIFGKAVVWLTEDEFVLRATSGTGTFTFKKEDLKICRKTGAFEHGEFSIDAEHAGLGQLLEVSGRCQAPAEGSKNAYAKMIGAGHIHLAVRGLSDVDAWVQRLGGPLPKPPSSS